MMHRAIISLCVLIALTLSSFGHRTLSPQDQAQAQAYVLAGGDWADLCADGGAPLTSAATCMACVVALGCAVPPPAFTATTIQVEGGIYWSVQEAQQQTAIRSYAHAARAPPFRMI